jgi:hypothetical protein
MFDFVFLYFKADCIEYSNTFTMPFLETDEHSVKCSAPISSDNSNPSNLVILSCPFCPRLSDCVATSIKGIFFPATRQMMRNSSCNVCFMLPIVGFVSVWSNTNPTKKTMVNSGAPAAKQYLFH